MLFSVGTRVKFLHSHDKGTVTALLSGGMVNVLLDDGMEIPVFEEDIIKADENHPATIQPAQIDLSNTEDFQVKKFTSAHPDLPKLGLQLAFEPHIKPDATVDLYDIHLINDTEYEYLFELKQSLKGTGREIF